VSAIVAVQCPECPAVIEVDLRPTLVWDDDGRQQFVIDPEMADLWAHSWSHQ
jgi:hypothetical protein